MTRKALEALRAGTPVVVSLPHGRIVRALYHSHFCEGKGRSRRTYARVLLPPRHSPVRVHVGRIQRVSA